MRAERRNGRKDGIDRDRRRRLPVAASPATWRSAASECCCSSNTIWRHAPRSLPRIAAQRRALMRSRTRRGPRVHRGKTASCSGSPRNARADRRAVHRNARDDPTYYIACGAACGRRASPASRWRRRRAEPRTASESGHYPRPEGAGRQRRSFLLSQENARAPRATARNPHARRVIGFLRDGPPGGRRCVMSTMGANTSRAPR
jgi:hypothetical protein